MHFLSGPSSPHRPTAVFVVAFVLIVLAAYHFGVIKKQG